MGYNDQVLTRDMKRDLYGAKSLGKPYGDRCLVNR
jgi:hypothetical protein